MGNFIDWNFTLTVLGDANGVLGHFGIIDGKMSLIRYYDLVCLLVDILWCGEFGFLYLLQKMSILTFARGSFKTRFLKHQKNGVVTIMLLFRIFSMKNM